MKRAFLVLAASAVMAFSAAAEPTLWVESAEPPVPRLQSGLPDFARLAQFADPAVVSIVATPREAFADASNPSARQFFERFYGSESGPGRGMASGFIIRPDGYILTNGHVVEDTAAIAVTLSQADGRSYPATVIGRDDLSDLALLKIDTDKPLQALPLGDSDAVAVGEWVTAIGNPFGLAQTVTIGIVSFKGRRDVNPSGRPGYYDFIQTDASINPGNSGGPLLDGQGRVIGISAAVNASGQGIAFAIPVNMAKDVLPALYEKGHVRRSFLGVSIQDLSPELAESFGVPGGVVVTEVATNGPASKAGIEVGDVITRFAGEPVAESHRLRWLASSAGVGRKVKLGLVRGGSAREVEITLGVLPGAERAIFRREAPPAARADLAPLGFSLDAKTPGPGGRGFRVHEVDPSSRAYAAGLREGDVIINVGQQQIRKVSDFENAAGESRGKVIRLYIQRGNKPMFLAFRP